MTAIGLACTIPSFGYYTCWTLLTVSQPSCTLSQRLGADPASRPCSPSSPTRHPCSPCFPSQESGQSESQLSSSSSDSALSPCSPDSSSSKPHTRTAPLWSAAETGPLAPLLRRTRGRKSGAETTRLARATSPPPPSLPSGAHLCVFQRCKSLSCPAALVPPRLTFHNLLLITNLDRIYAEPLPHNGSSTRAKAPDACSPREYNGAGDAESVPVGSLIGTASESEESGQRASVILAA